MKVAVISTTTYSTPPLAYGGEIFFWHLARGLCELGHQVTLYAAPGSLPPHPDCHCRLRYIPGTYGEISIGHSFAVPEWFYPEIMANDFVLDAEHLHAVAEWAAFYYRPDQKKIIVILNGATSTTPRCGPYNVVVGSQYWRQLLVMGRNEYFGTQFAHLGTTIQPVPAEDILGVIPWASDGNFYTPEGQKDDYFLWISHPAPYKGLPQALEVAARQKLRLVVVPGMAAASHRKDWEVVQPLIKKAVAGGARVEAIELPFNSHHHSLKRDLFRKARALLFPVQRHECFGLVVIEALLCGTPVITTEMGAMPEIIRNGETGFMCRDMEALCEATQKVGDLSLETCRTDAMARFHYRVAAEAYVKFMT